MPENPAAWPLWKRVGFRFAFLYWGLYILPAAGQVSLFDAIPWGNSLLDDWIGWPLAQLSQWVALHIFHLTGDGAHWHPTGSGDTAMNYVLIATIFVLALLGAALWTAIDEPRHRREYHTAYAWLRLAMRMTLALTLLGYGFAKVFPGQFGLKPSLGELSETYGESSPMHILWFFMTVSRPYTIFGGFGEVIPGVLLLFRRTSTLGLLGSVAVMANVVALNFCYDVPVKLYSTHLLLMSLFLLLPDMKPMWTFFVRRRPVELTGVWLPVWERKPLRIGAHILQGLFVAACAWSFIGGGYISRNTGGPESPIRGVWAVDSATATPFDSKTLIADNTRYVILAHPDGKREYAPIKYDPARHEVRFAKYQKETALTWTFTDPRTLKLEGKWMGGPMALTLHRVDPEAYPLVARGFHWVQENPYNH